MAELSFNQIESVIINNPVMEDLGDSRDFILDEIAGDVVTPSSFSVREEMTPAKSQGGRGTCSAFATTAIAEFFNAKEYKNRVLDLSEEYQFKRTKEIDIADYGYQGYGAYLRSAAKAYQKYGMCLESTLPYGGGKTEDSWKELSISRDMDVEAGKFKAKAYASVATSVEAIRKALVLTKSPLLFGMTLYQSYRQARDNGGYIPIPKDGEEKIGGHAMALVGYDDETGYFEVKNSWGDLWGDNGYIKIPYELITKMFSVWSFIDNIEETDEYLLSKMREEIPEEWGEEAFKAWDKAVEKGIVSPKTHPMKAMTTLEWLMFKNRAGEL